MKIRDTIGNFLRELIGLELYIFSYPLAKKYFYQKANKYAEELVKITEIPKSVLKEPLNIIPTRKYPSMVTSWARPRELFERRQNKRRIYLDYLELGSGTDLAEEVSHEIRDRIHYDKDRTVSEFFGMVGRILLERPDRKIHVPVVEEIEKYERSISKSYSELVHEEIDFKNQIKNWDNKTLLEELKRTKLDKKLIRYFARNSYPILRQRLERIVILQRFSVREAWILGELNHIDGYLAAVKNRRSIKDNSKGIYLLTEEEVKQRFFQNYKDAVKLR